jgi:hypothetical protein
MTRFHISKSATTGLSLLRGIKRPLIITTIVLLGIGHAIAQQAPNGNQSNTVNKSGQSVQDITGGW